MKKLIISFLEKDYLIMSLFLWGSLCWFFSYFLSLAELHSLTPPGHYIHKESQESLTFAVGYNVFEEIGTHPCWVLSPTHTQNQVPNTKGPKGRSCSGALT